MKGYEQVSPAIRSDKSRAAVTSKQFPIKKSNLGYSIIKQSKKIIIQKRTEH